MTTVTEKKACRACEKPFSENTLLDLGEQAVIDFLEPGEVGRGKAPLQLVYCDGCDLVQLRHTVDANTLYKKFWYRSSINEQMRLALRDIVFCAERFAELRTGDVVCDIGSNDGELLLNYSKTEVLKVGFEPADDLAYESMAKFRERHDYRWHIVPGYFNAIEALDRSGGKQYKVVTAIAMFYDLDNPNEFLSDVQSILAPDGVFVVQMNYLGTMVRNLAFDNIGHEHLGYYSLGVMDALLEAAGLGIVDVELNEVNGGSIRIYAMHKDIAKIRRDTAVIEKILCEEELKLSESTMKNFANRVNATSALLLNFLKDLRAAGKKVYVYGASTRGSTLLQTIFKGEKATDYLIAAAERDEKKYGKRMAGLDIPIIPEKEAREAAEYMLVLPYHFWKSIRQRERPWMSKGGRFILPLPYPKVMAFEKKGMLTGFPLAYDLEKELELIRA